MNDPFGEGSIEGVRAFDHTADVGLELSAPDLPALLQRGALGLAWLLLDRPPEGNTQERQLHLAADSAATLLRELLRELLWWHESEGLSPVHVDANVSESGRGLDLDASVTLAADPGPPLREIKGVTLHGLVAERRGEGWYGRVIFDV